jgi:hypothetical protein
MRQLLRAGTLCTRMCLSEGVSAEDASISRLGRLPATHGVFYSWSSCRSSLTNIVQHEAADFRRAGHEALRSAVDGEVTSGAAERAFRFAQSLSLFPVCAAESVTPSFS